jgi:hypothetical protein
VKITLDQGLVIMRVRVLSWQFLASASRDAVIARVTDAVMEDGGLEVIHRSAREVCYQYAGDLPLTVTTGFILKGTCNTFVARVSVFPAMSATVVRFGVLADIRGLAGCAILSLGWFLIAAIILRSIIWLTTDPADRIAGAIGGSAMIALGMFATRLLLTRVSREIRAFRRPVEKVRGARQDQSP